MNAQGHRVHAQEPDTSALKDQDKRRILVDFDAIATAGNDDDAFVEGTATLH